MGPPQKGTGVQKGQYCAAGHKKGQKKIFIEPDELGWGVLWRKEWKESCAIFITEPTCSQYCCCHTDHHHRDDHRDHYRDDDHHQGQMGAIDCSFASHLGQNEKLETTKNP